MDRTAEQIVEFATSLNYEELSRDIRRTKIEINEEFSKQTPAIRNCRIEATTRDGSTVVAHRKLTLEEIERDVSDGEIEEKFPRLAQSTLSEQQQVKLLKLGWRLETLSRIDPLIDLLRTNDGFAPVGGRS